MLAHFSASWMTDFNSAKMSLLSNECEEPSAVSAWRYSKSRGVHGWDVDEYVGCVWVGCGWVGWVDRWGVDRWGVDRWGVDGWGVDGVGCAYM